MLGVGCWVLVRVCDVWWVVVVLLREASLEEAGPADEAPDEASQQGPVEQEAMGQERPPQRPILHLTEMSGLRAADGLAKQDKAPQQPGRPPILGPPPSSRVMDQIVPQPHAEDQRHCSRPKALWIAVLVAMVMVMVM